MIEAKDIKKIFHNGGVEQAVLKGINLSVKAGEFIAVIGKSGAGKSTLLYQLGLLDQPTSGTIEIDGEKVSHLSDNDQIRFRLHMLGYIFQDYALVPELTATENVIVPLLMRGDSFKDAMKKAHEALSRVGLGHRLANLPSQLSGGEQQRVSIARAIAHDPKIIFADEPTANLDSETSRAVMDVFLDLHKEGQTIVMVTHEEEYAALTQRIIHLRDGMIVSKS